jgi:acyl-CoA synthetase (NDP forming)
MTKETLMTTGTAEDLDRIFYSRSVSIIGASNRKGSFGRAILEGFINMGFPNIFPVNPWEKELLGIKTFTSVKEIPCDIDLALLLIPQKEVLEVVKECVGKLVKGIIIFSAGFREKSEEGKKIEEEIARIARLSGTRIIGPNSNGIYSPSFRLCTFPSSLMVGGLPVENGVLSIFAQSGSFTDYISLALTAKIIRFSKAVSSGNECDLNSVDYLEYFGRDKETRIIAGYLEGIQDGSRLYGLFKDISRNKPIILWKGGLTETGARAAVAHTGALVGVTQVWEAVFKQTGVVSVGSFEEMVDCILAFYWLPLPKGKRVAILSGMGGTNVGTTDNCIAMGLEIAKISQHTIQKLLDLIPSAGTAVANPLDLGVGVLISPDLYGEAAKILAKDENVDMLIVITGPDNVRSIKSISEAASEIKKPFVVSLFNIPGLIEPMAKDLLEKHIPTYSDVKKAVFALNKLAAYAAFRAGY